MTPPVGCLLLFIVGGSAPALSLICQQMAALAVIQPELALFGSIGFLSILLIVNHFNISTFQHFNISTFQYFNISTFHMFPPIHMFGFAQSYNHSGIFPEDIE